MAENYKKIGITGGTFDPIHYGHLIIAESAREAFELDRVVFIPSGTPPHKKLSKVTASEHRFNMVYMAISSHPCFEVSDIEIARSGYTYTIDTLLQLKASYGDGTKLFFITGADVILDLLFWKDYKKVFTMCEFIAAFRPDYEKDRFLREIEHLKAAYGAVIHLLEAPLIEISSTSIRQKVCSGKSIKYVVPESVEGYIIQNSLYRKYVEKGNK